MKVLLKLVICTLSVLVVAYSSVAFAAGQLDGKTMRFRSDIPDREGRRVGIMNEDWFYCHPKSGEVFLVPRTFVTDYASVPWFSQLVGFQQFGKHKEAALIHDWLYAVGETGERKHADKIFLEELKSLGVGFIKRRTMYRGVRVGGKEAFGRDDEWNNRFIDPDSGETIDPPFAKPNKAAITIIPECDSFENKLDSLREDYGTHFE